MTARIIHLLFRYVFESFFKQLFLASTLGIINGHSNAPANATAELLALSGLFLLPILLKLIARGDHAGFERNHEELPEASADDVQVLSPLIVFGSFRY